MVPGISSSMLAVISSPSLLQWAISPEPTRTGSGSGGDVDVETEVGVRKAVEAGVDARLDTAGVWVGTATEGVQPTSRRPISKICKNFTKFLLGCIRTWK